MHLQWMNWLFDWISRFKAVLCSWISNRLPLTAALFGARCAQSHISTSVNKAADWIGSGVRLLLMCPPGGPAFFPVNLLLCWGRAIAGEARHWLGWPGVLAALQTPASNNVNTLRRRHASQGGAVSVPQLLCLPFHSIREMINNTLRLSSAHDGRMTTLFTVRPICWLIKVAAG